MPPLDAPSKLPEGPIAPTSGTCTSARNVEGRSGQGWRASEWTQRARRRLNYHSIGLLAMALVLVLTESATSHSWGNTYVRGLSGAILQRAGELSGPKRLQYTDYRSRREPPPGHQTWVRFAEKHQCYMGAYERIEDDLEAFRQAASDETHGSAASLEISRSQLEAAKQLPGTVTFKISEGRLTSSSEGKADFTAKFVRLMQRFVRFLPDMEFVVNEMDEPRILPGTTLDVDARLQSRQCRNASGEFRRFWRLHGAFNNRADSSEYLPVKELLPIFSQTKVTGCHADIMYPTLYGLDNLLTPDQESELLPWSRRNGTLFFRGASTGGHYGNGSRYRNSHRHRLIDAARGEPDMDLAFSSFVQCREAVCRDMEEHYGRASPVEQLDNFGYKYLMLVDGNTFLSRLPLFLSSGSLVFRAGLFSEWYDEWLRPDEHYVRIRLDFADLRSRLDWAVRHDRGARAIAQRARQFARKRLRNEDMECYLYRLLLEYAAILQPR